jgi:hypothetical protein
MSERTHGHVIGNGVSMYKKDISRSHFNNSMPFLDFAIVRDSFAREIQNLGESSSWMNSNGHGGVIKKQTYVLFFHPICSTV